MSYSKLEVHYTTDGVNTLNGTNTRKARTVKKKTISLPNKVIEYGDRHGYSSISIFFTFDIFTLWGGSEKLMEIDINGANNNEYIASIVSTKWL